MKKSRGSSSKLNFVGTLAFFFTVAFVAMVVVLIYDYIIGKTSNKGLISVLILIVICILSVVGAAIDAIRRKLMIDRPVTKILDATERIAKGDFSVRLDLSHDYGKYTKYDLVMENLNVMAAELGKTELLKSDFISNVSHEIKTPLAIIQNYATALQSEDLDKETREKYTKTLIHASKRISDLITNILKLNKLENQEIKAENVAFDLTAALSETVLEFEDLLENKNLTLECDFEEVTLFSSPALLEIVWNNLLSNAIKFTNEGGRVEVSLKKKGEQAVVSVSDSGVGISKETGKKIFEKFYQGDTSHSQEGNGLGLALVKKVIDILGGEINVESELGKGSTFTITVKGVTNETDV